MMAHKYEYMANTTLISKCDRRSAYKSKTPHIPTPLKYQSLHGQTTKKNIQIKLTPFIDRV